MCKYGKKGGDTSMAGMGGSDLPDIAGRILGTCRLSVASSAWRARPIPNSANSQFFIMFAPGDFLNGQYTVIGKVIKGMEVVDAIKKGDGDNGAVTDPDVMTKVTVQE